MHNTRAYRCLNACPPKTFSKAHQSLKLIDPHTLEAKEAAYVVVHLACSKTKYIHRNLDQDGVHLHLHPHLFFLFFVVHLIYMIIFECGKRGGRGGSWQRLCCWISELVVALYAGCVKSSLSGKEKENKGEKSKSMNDF